MGHKLPPEERQFYKRIDEVLFYKWDPIGISDTDWPRDEYKTYLPQVFKLAIQNDDPEPIADYLFKIETEYMDVSRSKTHDMKIAELILDIKDGMEL